MDQVAFDVAQALPDMIWQVIRFFLERFGLRRPRNRPGNADNKYQGNNNPAFNNQDAEAPIFDD